MFTKSQNKTKTNDRFRTDGEQPTRCLTHNAFKTMILEQLEQRHQFVPSKIGTK